MKTLKGNRMSRRSKGMVWSLVLLVGGLAAWGTVQRSRQSNWVANLRQRGVRAITEQSYESGSDSFSELCRSIYAGRRVSVLIGNEADARLLLEMKGNCPGQLEIVTYLDLSADWFSRLQEQFPAADLVARVPEDLFDHKSGLPVKQVSVGHDGAGPCT